MDYSLSYDSARIGRLDSQWVTIELMLALYLGVDQPIRLHAFVLLLQREVLAFFYFLSVYAGKLLLGVTNC